VINTGTLGGIVAAGTEVEDGDPEMLVSAFHEAMVDSLTLEESSDSQEGGVMVTGPDPPLEDDAHSLYSLSS